jgi:hypothetical protein
MMMPFQLRLAYTPLNTEQITFYFRPTEPPFVLGQAAPRSRYADRPQPALRQFSSLVGNFGELIPL